MHEDIANAITGLCGLASAKCSSYISNMSWVGGPDDKAPSAPMFAPSVPFISGSTMRG